MMLVHGHHLAVVLEKSEMKKVSSAEQGCWGFLADVATGSTPSFQ